MAPSVCATMPGLRFGPPPMPKPLPSTWAACSWPWRLPCATWVRAAPTAALHHREHRESGPVNTDMNPDDGPMAGNTHVAPAIQAEIVAPEDAGSAVSICTLANRSALRM